MKKLTYLLIFIFQLTIVQCKAEYSSDNNNSDTLYVATWNVENLFDTIDDPVKSDEEYTPEGSRQWDEVRLDQKFKNLAKVIKYMNAGKGPDLLGVQEVENEVLLKRLAGEYLSDKNYKIVYGESLDNRGIDTGLLYNAEKFELVSFDTLRVGRADNWPTRYILYAELKIKSTNEIINIFVNHWPSRSGGAEKSEPHRISAALVLKTFTDSLLKNDPEANIVIIGDFNDDPIDASVYDILKAQELECGLPGMNYLYNTSLSDFKHGSGTYLYRGSWNMLDQIIVSRSLIDKKKSDYVCGSFEVIKPDFMINKEGEYAGSSIRTFGGRNYIGGFSDHYPSAIKITVKK